MPEQTQWIDWHPKVGDTKPTRYRRKVVGVDMDWEDGTDPGGHVNPADYESLLFQIPAPVVTPATDRPPWIDPQCKFRWGDRVKYFEKVLYVINPNDADIGRVIAAPSLWEVPPYSTKDGLVDSGLWDTTRVDGYTDCTLTPYPENLPQHFDDRLLDADGPQEVARLPIEVWMNEYSRGELGGMYRSEEEAISGRGNKAIRTIHFREVL